MQVGLENFSLGFVPPSLEHPRDLAVLLSLAVHELDTIVDSLLASISVETLKQFDLLHELVQMLGIIRLVLGDSEAFRVVQGVHDGLETVLEPVGLRDKVSLAGELYERRKLCLGVNLESNQSLGRKSISSFLSIGKATLPQQLLRFLDVSLRLSEHLKTILQGTSSHDSQLLDETSGRFECSSEHAAGSHLVRCSGCKHVCGHSLEVLHFDF